MKKKGDAPAFLFDVDAWLTSVKIAMMTAEQERGYLRLLLFQWKDPQCRLPDDDSLLAVLSKMGEGWFNGGSTLVRSCFKSEGGFLINERLLRERERWTRWQKKSSEGGKRSAQSRKKKADSKGGSTTVQPPFQHDKENSNKNMGNSAPFNSDLEPELENAVMESLLEICGIDLEQSSAKLRREIQDAYVYVTETEAGRGVREIVGMLQAFGAWHFEISWAGKVPWPNRVREKWGEFKLWKTNGLASNGRPANWTNQSPDDQKIAREYVERMRERDERNRVRAIHS